MKEKISLKTVLSWGMALFVLWMLWTNLAVGFTKLTVKQENLPENFDGLRIVHISDFHNWSFSGMDGLVMKRLKAFEPDFIAITGDIVDAHRTNIPLTLSFVEQLAEVAPCYYSTGNHEGALSEIDRQWLFEGMEKSGVILLHDEAVTLEREGQTLIVAGLDDRPYSVEAGSITVAIDSICQESDYNIVLSHKPHYFEEYKASAADLVLSGHVHGGQAKLPFVGGLYGPHQGILPEYDAGLYQDGDFAMVVSRGIGNSRFPIRFNNQPEMLLIELKRQ